MANALHSRCRLLCLTALVLAIRRFAESSQLSYFALKAHRYQSGISPLLNGAIWSSYALGMLIAFPSSSKLVLRLGSRSAAVSGLIATAVQALAFATTSLLRSTQIRPYVFVAANFLSGLIGGVGETAVITKSIAAFRDDGLGAVMAVIAAAGGLGATLGPLVGGALSEAGAAGAGDELAFQLPYFVTAALALIGVAAVVVCVRDEVTALPLAHFLAGAEMTPRNELELGDMEAYLAGDAAGPFLESAAVSKARLSLSFLDREQEQAPGRELHCGGERVSAMRGGGSGYGAMEANATAPSVFGTVAAEWEHEEEEEQQAVAAAPEVLAPRGDGASSATNPASGDALLSPPRGCFATPRWQRFGTVATPSLYLALITTIWTSTLASALQPFLAYRLGDSALTPATAEAADGVNATSSAPALNSIEIGAMLALASVSAVGAAIPVGWLLDVLPGRRRLYKLIQSCGLIALALAFALIGPFTLPGLGGYGSGAFEDWDAKLRPSIILVGVAMVSVCTVYDQLLFGLNIFLCTSE